MTIELQNSLEQGLFSEQHRGLTLITHNFRCYDDNFILKYLLDNQQKTVRIIKRGKQLLDLQYEKAEINVGNTIKIFSSETCKLC